MSLLERKRRIADVRERLQLCVEEKQLLKKLRKCDGCVAPYYTDNISRDESVASIPFDIDKHIEYFQNVDFDNISVSDDESEITNPSLVSNTPKSCCDNKSTCQSSTGNVSTESIPMCLKQEQKERLSELLAKNVNSRLLEFLHGFNQSNTCK